MTKVFSILSMLTPQFVIRSYLIASIYLGFFYFLSSNSSGEGLPILFWLYVSVCWLVFPLAKLIYEEIIGLILGNNFITLPLVFFAAWKLIINAFLFGSGIYLAPLGFLYLWYKSNQEQHSG